MNSTADSNSQDPARTHQNGSGDRERGGPAQAQAALPAGSRVGPDRGRYLIVRKIGSGSSATVYRAFDTRDQRTVAIKLFDIREASQGTEKGLTLRSKLAREIAIGRECGTMDCVVRLEECFVQGDLLALVMEFVDGEDLLACINRHDRRLGESLARHLFRQLCGAVESLHASQLCHRDIKPENILIEYGTYRLKICDLGLSKHIQSAVTLGIGTPGYLAPELIIATEDAPRQGQYDAMKADAWGVGASLYLMVAGWYPFSSPTEGAHNSSRAIASTLRNQVAGRMRPLPEPLRGSPVEDLIKRLLEPDPRKRASIAEAIAHPWTQSATEQG
ncbi:unnamed protein product [Pedinophyceae sp. YPF-701]|nr:unnamed protein product [Pedinophyceae sp. YPF-701]